MTQRKPHITFWIAAGLGLVWYLAGCMNYIAQTNPASVAQMHESYQLIIKARPAWATAGFAIGVFGGAVGCILMLLRRKVAVAVLVLSLMGTLLTGVFITLLVGLAPPVVLSTLIAAALLWYATIARRSGWLA
ncbi:hypothetical protein [uncultured Sulfitobacter sp.]|uniref:hypothetical protein n=1 Tax=uncultured Sulfitobacter sp. TaxID=191468 RepID=UPI00261BD095|nr:hypothetical protein [uncultured Sulfitobacter sp.]